MTKEYSHYVVATAIISRNNQFLIVKRDKDETAMAGFWAFPGGKLNLTDYFKKPKNTNFHWHHILDYLLMRECKEEVGLEISNIRYVRNLAFIRPDNIPTVVLSFMADYHAGEVRLNEELSKYAWVTLAEARNYNLIDGLYEELLTANRIKNH